MYLINSELMFKLVAGALGALLVFSLVCKAWKFSGERLHARPISGLMLLSVGEMKPHPAAELHLH